MAKEREGINGMLAGMFSVLVGSGLVGGLAQLARITYPWTVSFFSIYFFMSWVKVAYLLCVSIIPIILWKIYGPVLREVKKLNGKGKQRLYITLLVVFGFALYQLGRMIDWQFYYKLALDQLMTYTSPKTYGLAILFLVSCWMGLRQGKWGKYLIPIAMGGVALYLANFAVINDWHRYNGNPLNISVVIYSVVQVFFGKAVLIDQKSQYGLYAHFLEPILQMLGGISIFNISLIMAGLVFVSVLSIGLFMWLVIRNKWLALTGFLATLYFNYFIGQLWPEDLYYQYYPIRTLFPTLLLPAYYWYRSKPSVGKYWLLWIVFALGTIWNLDVGIFTYFALGVTHVYREGLGKLGKHIVGGGAALIGVWGGFFGYERLRYGSWPQLSEVFSAQKLFMSGAVLDLHQVWVWIGIIYLLGVVAIISKLYQKEKTKEGEGMLLVTTMGIGIFTYYLNNPHDSVLTNCGYPAIILLTLLVDQAWKKRRNWLPVWVGVGILCFLAASGVQNLRYSRLVGDTVTMEDLNSPEIDSAKSLWAVQNDCTTCMAFVYESDYARNRALSPLWVKKAEYAGKYKLQNGMVRDDLLILSNWDYLLYLHANARAPLMMVNFRHLFLENEWEELYSLISHQQSRYLIMDEEIALLTETVTQHPKQKIDRLWELIKSNYQEVRREKVGDQYGEGMWHPSYISTWESKTLAQ